MDFNPNSPDVRGMETRYAKSREVQLNSPLIAVAFRTVPGAVNNDRIHRFLRAVQGTPGLVIERVPDADLMPDDITTTEFLPGSDTGALTTGWVDQSSAAVNFGDVDDQFDSSDFAWPSSIIPGGSSRSLLFRADDAGALAGQRILDVNVFTTAHLVNSDLNAVGVWVRGVLRIDAVDYFAGAHPFGRRALLNFERRLVGAFPFHPATGLPWTVGEVDDLIDAADADMFGLNVGGKVTTFGFPVSSFGLVVTHCTENRAGYLNSVTQPRTGWARADLTNTAAASANTFEWIVVSCPKGSTAHNALVALVNAPGVVTSDDATATPERRQAAILELSHPAGVATKVTRLPTEHLAVLMEASAGSISVQSQPYAAVNSVARHTGAVATVGQQVTTDTAETYAGVKLPLGWETKLRPDQPLTVSVQSGAGAIDGSGTELVSGSLDPDAFDDGTIAEHVIPFTAPTAFAATTQYHILIASEAISTRAWTVALGDTRSDTVTTGGVTTVANVEAQSQGGQTDSYVQGGSAFDRYDLPLSLVPAPTAPANFAATPVAAEVDEHGHSRLPPRVDCSWDATSLAANFGGYSLYRRPRRTPAEAWGLWCEIPPGDDPAVTEANETEAVDEMAGWGVVGARYEHGWDYAVSVTDASTGLESDLSTAADEANVVAGTSSTYITNDSWVTCNEARWLSMPLRAGPGPSADPYDNREVFPRMLGRDHAVVVQTGDVPGRTYRLTEIRKPATPDLSQPNEDILRIWRAASLSGRVMALLQSRGDLAYGKPGYPGTDHGDRNAMGAEADFITTDTSPPVCGYNLPPGLVLDGAADFLSVPDHADLDPASDAFTLVLYASIPDVAGTAVSKGNLGTADGYGFQADGSATITFAVDGASASGGPAADGFTGARHVFAGASSGTAQTLHVDGMQVATSAVTHGAMANAIALAIGANNAGASGFSAIDFSALALYRRVLTADEQKAAARYLMGWKGYRMPAGAVLFLDVRDQRSGSGEVVLDLSGRAHHATVTGTPARRGSAWPLADLEQAD